MDAARFAAAAALVQMHRGGYANLIAKNALEAKGLSVRDKAFAAALFFGAAERVLTLDFLLRPFLKRPVEKLDTEVRAILETGLYQALYMRVPESAAVNESVSLARAFGKKSAAPFVNAVLRKAVHAQLEDAVFTSEGQRIGVLYSVGEAVAEAVMASLPEEYEAFLAASFSKGEECLRVNTLKTTTEALAAQLAEESAEVRDGFLPDCLYVKRPGGAARHALFAQGLYHIQGEAEQYAAFCAVPPQGGPVLDVCAAPGGKSAILAQMRGGGEGLTACDVNKNRLALVREAFSRLGIEGARVMANDAAQYNQALAGQASVLCDVPCSGLGVLREKADLRYTTGEKFAALPALQLKILQTSARYVQKGGRLVYCTCTVRKEENEEVVRAFLTQNAAFRPVPPTGIPPGAVICDEMVTVLPHRTGLDGFFVATFEKVW